jgi:hypothetical protein
MDSEMLPDDPSSMLGEDGEGGTKPVVQAVTLSHGEAAAARPIAELIARE